MKRLLLAILLSFPLLASAALPQCAKNAIKAHKDVFQYASEKEIENYIEMWCSEGKDFAKSYLMKVTLANILEKSLEKPLD